MNIQQSRFFCTECGREGVPIMRPKGAQRESGHLKKLYCIYCQKEVNHAEIRENGNYTLEDFQQEFNLGRFKNGDREAISELSECSCAHCPFNVNGRCWNSNRTNNCGHRIIERDDNNE